MERKNKCIRPATKIKKVWGGEKINSFKRKVKVIKTNLAKNKVMRKINKTKFRQQNKQ
jgi:hypothetical protein